MSNTGTKIEENCRNWPVTITFSKGYSLIEIVGFNLNLMV